MLEVFVKRASSSRPLSDPQCGVGNKRVGQAILLFPHMPRLTFSLMLSVSSACAVCRYSNTLTTRVSLNAKVAGVCRTDERFQATELRLSCWGNTAHPSGAECCDTLLKSSRLYLIIDLSPNSQPPPHQMPSQVDRRQLFWSRRRYNMITILYRHQTYASS